MSMDAASIDLILHAACAVAARDRGQSYEARLHSLWAGIAAVKAAAGDAAAVSVPEGLMDEPLRGWFAEGIALGSRHPAGAGDEEWRRMKSPVASMRVRPGANPAARSVRGEDE